jgi:hypothetical protein
VNEAEAKRKTSWRVILYLLPICLPSILRFFATSDLEHVFIAGSFFHYAGLFEPPVSLDISPNPGRSDPLFIVKAAKKKST